MLKEKEKHTKGSKTNLFVAIGMVIGVLGFAGLLISNMQLTRTDSTSQAKYLNSDTPTVVMFYSKDCPYCKKIARWVKYSDLRSTINSNNYRNTVYLERHNNHDQQLFAKYGVNRTPTFMVLKNGEPESLGKDKDGLPIMQYVGINKHKIMNIYKYGNTNGKIN